MSGDVVTLSKRNDVWQCLDQLYREWAQASEPLVAPASVLDGAAQVDPAVAGRLQDLIEAYDHWLG